MKKLSLIIITFAWLLTGCRNRQPSNGSQLRSIQLSDRNGFKETISAPERLKCYEKADFFTPQPYEKVVRIFSRNAQGKTSSKLTLYHENGELWKYLEVVNGRACGTYREWYENGNVHLELTVVEGVGDLSEEAQVGWVFDGRSRVWDRDGHLLAEIYYEKGKLQGNALHYHPNQKVSKLIPYENDLIDGNFVYYDTQGVVIGKTPYIRGEKHGIATFKGDLLQPAYSEEYDHNLLIEGTYHDFSGKIVGRVEKGYGRQPIFVNRELRSIHEYQDGKLEGDVQLFDERRQLKSLFYVKDDMKHGEEWVYFPSVNAEEPQPKLYLQWYEDVIQGITRTWYLNGTLESEREMYDNKKHGVSSAWYRDGSLMMIEEYENDVLIKGTYMKRGDPTPASKIESGEGTATFYSADGMFLKRVSYKKGLPVDDL